MWYSLDYNIMPDGDFSIKLYDQSVVDEANEDFTGLNHREQEYFKDELLSYLSCNDVYSVCTPLGIMMMSISDDERTRMIRMGHKAIIVELDAFERKEHKDGIKLDLEPHQDILCELDIDDYGDIEKIHKLWIFPNNWVSSLLAGKTIVLKQHIYPELTKEK